MPRCQGLLTSAVGFSLAFVDLLFRTQPTLTILPALLISLALALSLQWGRSFRSFTRGQLFRACLPWRSLGGPVHETLFLFGDAFRHWLGRLLQSPGAHAIFRRI